MKKVIFGTAAIVIIILVVIRIANVNENIVYPEVKEYGMQEEAPIGDNIFMEDYEKMDGYSIAAEEAELLTYDEFLEKFQYDEEEQGQLYEKDDMIYPEMIYNVKVVIKNNNKEDDPEKGINLQNYVLYGKDFQLQLSALLYAVANPEMESGQMSFRLKPETEMEFYLPFYFSPSRKVEPLQIEEVVNSKLYLPISLYPEQRQIVLKK